MSPGEMVRRVLYFVRRDYYTAQLDEEMRLHVHLRACGMWPSGSLLFRQYQRRLSYRCR
jgi:hypothetical protein